MLKFRSLASQLCGILPYICLQFSTGCFTGYMVVIVAELHKKDSEILATLDQLSWFASLDIMKPVGTMATGFLMHRLGCRPSALITALSFIVSGLLYHFASSVGYLYAGRVLASIISVKSLCNPYISEISEPQYRGQLLGMANLSGVIGTFFTLLFASFMYWRTIALVNIVLPIVAAVTILAIPQSPSWLVNKGRTEEAEKALCWLRGWVKPEEIRTEFSSLVENHKQLKSNSEEVDVESATFQQSSLRFYQLFLQRSFCTPFGTICLILLVYIMCGMDTIEAYSTVIFRELHSPIEESVATAIMEAMVLIGCLIMMLFVHRAGKRKLVFFSVVVTGSCHAVIALIGFMKFEDEYLWIPPIAVIIAKFANTTGVGAFVYMIPSEIFPSSVRYIGSSISLSAKMVASSLIKKVFLYAVAAITLPGVFAFFALMNLIALVTYYFLFPETEGKSLREIENHYKGVRAVQDQ